MPETAPRLASTTDSGPSPVTARLAGLAAGLRAEALPPDVARRAAHCLLDWAGVALAGSREPVARIVLADALERASAPQASVIGAGERLSALDAALVNGTASHALDYDDVNHAMLGHPTVPVASAVLALAEREGASGRDVVTAFVAGVETECRLGRFLTGAHYARGFHATGTVGTVGAAAGCARLLGLDAAASAAALGIAATQAAGLKAMFGTMCKPLHAGKAAANGLHAALLARRGLTTRTDALECEQGLAETHTPDTDAAAALAGAGERFDIRGTLFKYHAACYGTHATIDAAARIRERAVADPSVIDSVELRVPLANLRMCDIARPRTGLEAKFSLRLAAAMALCGLPTGDIRIYDEALCAREDLAALAARTRVVGDEALGGFEAAVAVRTVDGAVHRERADAGVPEPDLDRQERRLSGKFLALAGPVLGEDAARDLASRVLRIAETEDVRRLFAT